MADAHVETYIIARPPNPTRNSHGLIVQLQQLTGEGRRLPAYNLATKKGHVADPKEAIMTDYDDHKIASFKRNKRRRGSVAHQPLRTNSSRSIASAMSNSNRSNDERPNFFDEPSPEGYIRLFSGTATSAHTSLTVVKTARGYDFTCVLSPALQSTLQSEVYTIRWLRRVKGAHRERASTMRSLPSRTLSSASDYSSSGEMPTQRKSNSIGPGNHLTDEWVCKIKAGVAKGATRVSRLSPEKLEIFDFPLSATRSFPRSIFSSVLISSALWVISQTFEPHVNPRISQLISSPGSHTSSRASSIRAPTSRQSTSNSTTARKHQHSNSDSSGMASTIRQHSPNLVPPPPRQLKTQTIKTPTRDLSTGVTQAPTCFSFLSFFKFFSSRDKRQGRSKNKEMRQHIA